MVGDDSAAATERRLNVKAPAPSLLQHDVLVKLLQHQRPSEQGFKDSRLEVVSIPTLISLRCYTLSFEHIAVRISFLASRCITKTPRRQTSALTNSSSTHACNTADSSRLSHFDLYSLQRISRSFHLVRPVDSIGRRPYIYLGDFCLNCNKHCWTQEGG